MSEYVHLIGAEQVSGSGHNMVHAAAEMSRAASSISESLFRQQQFMSQWLVDFERIIGGIKS